jgi:hypothetical protein
MPCAGYSGCNTIQNWEQRRSCMKNNCFCDIGMEKKLDLTATESPMCIVCGKYNQCESNKSLTQRRECLSKNCGGACINQMDTFPPIPVEPFVYFPRTRIR